MQPRYLSIGLLLCGRLSLAHSLSCWQVQPQLPRSVCRRLHRLYRWLLLPRPTHYHSVLAWYCLSCRLSGRLKLASCRLLLRNSIPYSYPLRGGYFLGHNWAVQLRPLHCGKSMPCYGHACSRHLRQGLRLQSTWCYRAQVVLLRPVSRSIQRCQPQLC